MWRTARLDAICRRTKLLRSSACAARSTESTKPRAAQGAGRANLAVPFRVPVQRRATTCEARPSAIRSISSLSGGGVCALATPADRCIHDVDRRIAFKEEKKCSGHGGLLELLLQLRPDLRWGRTALPARKCSSDCAPPATKLGRTPKSSSAHRSMASMAARAAPSRVSTTLQLINLPASPGARKLSPNISARRCKKCRARAWHLSASRTTRTSQTSGPISSSSGLMGRRNETRRAGKRGKSKRATRSWQPQRLVSRQCWVDWPAQPYLKPAQTLSRPSNHRRRSRWTEWRAGAVKWKDDTHPPANFFPTIFFLIYIAREIALQDHRAEIGAEEAAHRELALLLITKNWRVQIGGIETDPSHLPLAEAMAHRQINVDEVWITSREGDCR